MIAHTLGLLVILLFAIAQPPIAAAQHASTGVESTVQASAESAAEAISRAETAADRAADQQAEWLETRGLIEQARKEAGLGNYEQAVALAEQARQQGELALAQAEREAEAWRQRVVR